MNLLAYLLSVIVAFSGVFVGAFLAMTAREEMPTGRKYFPLLQKVLIIAIVAILLSYFNIILPLRLLTYAFVVFILLRMQTLDFYPILAVAFFLLGQESKSLFAVAAIVFLYGFPTGSTYVIKNKHAGSFKTLGKVGLRYAVFPVLAVVLQLLYLFFR